MDTIENTGTVTLVRSTLLALLMMPAMLPSQQDLRLHSVHHQLPLGETPQLSQVSASGDFDGDGDADLIIGNRVGRNNLLFSDGLGSFEDRTQNLPIDLGECSGIAVIDVEQDGDLDLFFANRGQQNRLFLNDGAGRFSDVTVGRLPVDLDTSVAVNAGDLDGDGDLDLVIANSVRPGHVYLNDGRGNFTAMPFAFLSWPRIGECQALADVDGDSDLDLVVGSRSSSGPQDFLYLNDGTGRFLDVTSIQYPVVLGETYQLHFFDADQDGDQDILTYSRTGLLFEPLHARLLTNSGNGTFRDVTSTALAGKFSGITALVDVDRDQDLDIIISGEDLTILINRSGFFGAIPKSPVLLASSLVALDADGDGDTDLFIGGSGGVSRDLLLSDGQGKFVSANESGLPSDSPSLTKSIAFADIDQDGDLDIIKLDSLWIGRFSLYLNDAMGRFVDVSATAFPPLPNGATDIAIGDIDGDGDPDIVVSYGFFGSNQNRLLIQFSPGKFLDASANLPADLDPSMAVALADFDGDLDLDLVVANGSSDHKVYLNDGTGIFAAGIPMSGGSLGTQPTALAHGDIDGDGDRDIVVVMSERSGTFNQTFLNDGSGKMTSSAGLPASSKATNDVALADLDGDGDLDLVFANGQLGKFGAKDQVLFNDGQGKFTDVTATSLPGFVGVSLSLALVDLDEDGDLDLLFGPGSTVQTFQPIGGFKRLLINDGRGRFTDRSASWFSQQMTAVVSMDVGDFDLDGDLDVLVGQDRTTSFSGDGQTQIYENGLRQLRVPHVARVGQVVEYEFTALQTGASPGMAVLCLSPATAGKIKLPGVGILQLDPVRLIALPSVPFSASGSASLSFRVPVNAALVNRYVYAQALVGHSLGGPYHLTNTIRHIVIN